MILSVFKVFYVKVMSVQLLVDNLSEVILHVLQYKFQRVAHISCISGVVYFGTWKVAD